MMKPNPSIALIFPLIAVLACNALVSAAPTQTASPSPVPHTPIPLSSQLTLTSVPFEETSQSPVYTMRAQIPVLTGSDDPRLPAFNQVLNDLVLDEVKIFRKNFLELPVTPYSTGSSFEEEYTLLWQQGETWSFKFDFNFYSDGAAHPGHYSRTLNYDLGAGSSPCPTSSCRMPIIWVRSRNTALRNSAGIRDSIRSSSRVLRPPSRITATGTSRPMAC